jgi:hypothetical protein
VRREILELLFLAESVGAWDISFLFPRQALILQFCRSRRGEQPSGGKVLRLIQDRLRDEFGKNLAFLSNQFAVSTDRRFQASHNAVIRVNDEAGNVIETYEHKGDFKEP